MLGDGKEFPPLSSSQDMGKRRGRTKPSGSTATGFCTLGREPTASTGSNTSLCPEQVGEGVSREGFLMMQRTERETKMEVISEAGSNPGIHAAERSNKGKSSET